MTKQSQPTISATSKALTSTAIGFLVWHQLRDVPVDPSELDKALTDKGFDADEWGSKPRSRVQVFSECVKRLVGRTYQTLDGRSQETRCMFPLSLPDSDDGHRLRSVHVAKGDKGSKKNSLAQVGIIAFNLDTEQVSWTFTGLERKKAGSQVESDDNYIKRFKAVSSGNIHITDADVDAFIQSARDVTEYVDKFGGKVDRRFMHFCIRDALYRRDMHAIPLRPSGGIYFLPHDGTKDSPALTFQRFARVIMHVCPADQIHMMPQYPDPDSKAAIANSAHMSLSGKVSDIKQQLDELESIDRISMVASKTDTINSVLATAALYRDLVGMQADELDDQITKVQDRIKTLTTDLDARKQANASARKTSRTSIKQQLKDAEAERQALLARIAELEDAAQAKVEPAPALPDGEPLTDGAIRTACKAAKGSPGNVIAMGALQVEHTDAGYAWELGSKAGSCKRVIDVVRQVKKAVA